MRTASPMSVLSIQVGKVRKVLISGRLVPTAIHKAPVMGPVAVGVMGLISDEQADPTVHGGKDKAVYAYPSEHYAFWQAERQKADVAGLQDHLAYGAVGENLSLQGLLENDVWVGDELHFADCILRVTQPREPCFKFNAAMGFNTAVKAMAQSGFCGFYLAVEKAGSIEAGESFALIAGPRQLSIAESFRAKMFKHMR
jgi:MOSC domain-containing protein YiiM